MVINEGDIVEACDPKPPPPCLSAFCMCAGGGFEGATIPLIKPTCDYFLKPCGNGDELCERCYDQAGCASGKKTQGGRVAMSCQRKDEKSPIICSLEHGVHARP